MPYKLSKTVYLTTLLISLLSILTLSIILFAYDYYTFNKSVESLKATYIKKEKQEIKNEVTRVTSLMEYNHSLSIKRIQKLTKDRVVEAHDIAVNIYSEYKNQKSKPEIIEIIKNTLRKLNFFDGWGYYFMYDLEGKLIMHGTKPEHEGTYKFKNFTDVNGKKVMQNIIEIIESKKEGFLTWFFYRPDRPNEQAEKTGYVKLIEPLNYFIGTADYNFRVEEELKKETLKRIKNISAQSKRYIFVLDSKGNTLLSKYFSNYAVEELSELRDPLFKEEISSIIKKSTKSKKGFLEYKIESSKPLKISYVETFEKWNWIVGTRSYLQELDTIIAEKKQRLQEKVINKVVFILGALGLLLFIIFYVSKYFTLRIDKSISVFVKFFQKVNIENQKISHEKLPFSEFQDLAKCINTMLDTKLQQEKDILLTKKEVLINSSLLSEYKKAVDAGTIVSKTDIKGTITYVNDQFCKISGYSRDELIGHNHRIVKNTNVKQSVYKGMWKQILNKKIWKGIIENNAKNGSSYYVKMTIVPILDINGEINEFIAIRYDVTDLIKQAKQIRVQTTDSLTGLPNRQKLLEDLEANDLKLAIFNIIRFKEINEYYGYDIGDEVIKTVSVILRKFINDTNTSLYKLQGDEFALLSNEQVTENIFKQYCQNIIEKFDNIRINIEENKLNISLLGGASFQKNYLINAEMSKNFAKDVKQPFIFFDDNMKIKDNIVENINFTQKIKSALRNDRIVIYIQPIILNSTNVINKYECLVRLIDKDGTVIPPFHFLNVAKKSNLYSQITKVVIQKAFEAFANNNFDFSINLTMEDMLNPETVDLIKQKLIKYPTTCNRVIFEIVEDEGIENYEEVSHFIEIVKHLGCRIAIDDFGTGYSNFDYLMKLNIDYLKIDGSMIRYLDHDSNAKMVTQLIVDFAKKLNIKTVAEFVHSEEIHSIVSKMGIDYSQGFHLGKPKPISQLK